MMGGDGGSIDGRPHRPVARGAATRISPLSVEVALENVVLFVVRCSMFVVRVALRAMQDDVYFVAFLA